MRSRVHSLWLLVDHCVLRNWDRILVRAVKGLISLAGMVSICRYCDKETLNSNKQTNKHIQPFYLFQIWYVDIYPPPPPPWATLILKFDTLRELEQLLSQPNDTCPKYSKCNISISNCLIAFKFYTGVKYHNLHANNVNDLINTQNAFVTTLLYPPILGNAISPWMMFRLL